MKPKAYSYLRFSTPEQAKGDSFRRQSRMAEEYAARHGLELDRDLTFDDLGVSAYRGLNAETGRLAEFKRAVEDELVQRGSFLLVESLDRISRQTARKAFRTLEDIVELGITVVTLNDGRAYSKDGLDNDPMSLMIALLTFVRANEESATKGRRVRAAWNNKRENARERPLTRRVPAWIAFEPEAKALRLIPDRAKVVARIFDMLASGVGQHRIAETLNREGIPTFGDNGTSRRAEVWHRSYISKIARSPAVIGTLVPHVIEHDGAGRKVRKATAPVEGYYPEAVEPEVFHRVQAQLSSGSAPKALAKDGVRSLFAGLAKCPSCGSTMTRVQKGPGGGRPKLVCTKAKVGGGCSYLGVPQGDVEDAFLRNFDFLAAAMPSGIEDLDARLAQAETTLDATKDAIANVLEGIAQNPAPSLLDKLTDLEETKEALEAEVSELAHQATSVASAAVARRMLDLEQVLRTEPVEVTRANALMRQSFDAVTVDYFSGALRFMWKQGGETAIQYAWPRQD